MTRDEKIRAIVEAMVLYEQIDMQLLSARDDSVRTLQIAHDDLVQRYSAVFPPSAMARLDVLSKSYGKQLADMWNTEDFIAVFVAEYGRDMSDDDLDRILGYYSSSAGRKDVRSAKIAVAMTMGAMLNQRRERLEPAMRDYNAAIERIFAEFGPPDGS